MTITDPVLSYQYNPAGELGVGWNEREITPEAPFEFKAERLERWEELSPGNAEEHWARLQELQAEALREHPENRIAQDKAWVAGIREMPSESSARFLVPIPAAPAPARLGGYSTRNGPDPNAIDNQ